MLSGTVADTWSNPNLASLNLEATRLTGPIPASLPVFASLKQLRLAGALMTGTLPNTFARLSSALLVDLGNLPLARNQPLPDCELLLVVCVLVLWFY